MASLNKSIPITGDQARDMCNQLVKLVKESTLQDLTYDWWYNSTIRKGVRTLRVRVFYPQTTQVQPLIANINKVLAESLAAGNYRTIHYAKLHHCSVTVFYNSGTLTSRKPAKFIAHDFYIWRLDPGLFAQHFPGSQFTQYVISHSTIPNKTQWLYPAFVERVAGPFRSNKKLHAELSRLNGK